MIFCCNAMRAEMALTDHLIFDDRNESLLTVHYALPRQCRPKIKPATIQAARFVDFDR
ncbi:hypothetical protein BF49_5124 [Bradyrhizobium sp.]|nr:hypothetical protein BF49_5124 [Bradyrhizobium sp.]